MKLRLFVLSIFFSFSCIAMEEKPSRDHTNSDVTEKVLQHIKDTLDHVEIRYGKVDFSDVFHEKIDEIIELLKENSDFEDILKEVKEILIESKSCVMTVKSILKHVKKAIKNNNTNALDSGKVILEENFNKLTKLLNENPEFLEVLKESAFGKKSLKTKAAQFISSLPENLWYECRGAFGGFTSACLLMMLINAVDPSALSEIFPQGFTALIGIPALLLICAKTYNLLKLPEPFTKIMMARAFNLVTNLAPAFVNAARIEVNTQVTAEMQKSFQDLIESLSKEQRDKLSAYYVLLRAQVDPLVLLNEIEFLNCLTKKQLKYVYIYLSTTIPDAINPTFEKFAEELTENQLDALKPKNKILLAGFNPKLLFAESNQAFLQLLSEQQNEQLMALSFN